MWSVASFQALTTKQSQSELPEWTAREMKLVQQGVDVYKSNADTFIVTHSSFPTHIVLSTQCELSGTLYYFLCNESFAKKYWVHWQLHIIERTVNSLATYTTVHKDGHRTFPSTQLIKHHLVITTWDGWGEVCWPACWPSGFCAMLFSRHLFLVLYKNTAGVHCAAKQ